jgi:hypothetical protein
MQFGKEDTRKNLLSEFECRVNRRIPNLSSDLGEIRYQHKMLLSIGDFPEIHRTEGVKEITLLHEP